MRFANPWFLLLLPALAALIWLRERQRSERSAALPFPDFVLLKGAVSSWRIHWRRLPEGLLVAGLALSIIALARPQSILRNEEQRARGIDIMIALDTSGSMRALDFNPMDRMAAARKTTRIFIERRKYDRIGLVVFAGVAMLSCPLTLDYGTLLTFLEDVQVGMTSTENTAIGTAIALASHHLRRSAAKSRILILVTDGRSNSGEVDPLTAAKAADALGIRIYTIGIGIRGESVIPVQTPFGIQLAPIQEDLDEGTLQQIAGAANGRYYRATSVKELEEIYADIDRLEKTDIKTSSMNEFKDHYFGWLLAALLLMGAGLLMEQTVFRTAP